MGQPMRREVSVEDSVLKVEVGRRVGCVERKERFFGKSSHHKESLRSLRSAIVLIMLG
jgi:hypothetical protein